MGKKKTNRTARNSPHFLAGEWKITVLQVMSGGLWKTFKRYGNRSFMWFFDDRGNFTEHYRKNAPFGTMYRYDPADGLLTVDRTHYGDENRERINSIAERHRVEAINADEVWLYLLEDVNNEPDDYRFRLKALRSERY